MWSTCQLHWHVALRSTRQVTGHVDRTIVQREVKPTSVYIWLADRCICKVDFLMEIGNCLSIHRVFFTLLPLLVKSCAINITI